MTVLICAAQQVYSMPVFDMLERILVRRRIRANNFFGRLVYRSIYVVFTGFVAISIPVRAVAEVDLRCTREV